MSTPPRGSLKRWLAGILLIGFTSFFNYVPNYDHPPQITWDEAYHLIYAQRYLHGTFFMQAHPPLGKLFIALGEYLLDADSNDEQFVGEERITNFKGTVATSGYRLFPVIFAWLCAPLLFTLAYLIIGDFLIALLVAALYSYDNAIIVHGRLALLDSTLFFGILAALTLLALFGRPNAGRRERIAVLVGIGFFFGWSAGTKLTGLVLIVAILPIVAARSGSIRRFIGESLFVLLAAAVTTLFIWQLHFHFAREVNPKLPNDGWFRATDTTKAWVSADMPLAFQSAPYVDNYEFMFNDHAGVPVLDLCKQGENGSPFYLWPFGGQAILYRWVNAGLMTNRYLALQPNPFAWLIGLCGLVILACAALQRALLATQWRWRAEHLWPCVLLVLYFSYMFAMSRLDRVMYLYHYFPALIVSYLAAGFALRRVSRLGPVSLSEGGRRTALCYALTIGVVLSYLAYRPLTYFDIPLDNAEFEQLNLFKYWGLQCIDCPRHKPW